MRAPLYATVLLIAPFGPAVAQVTGLADVVASCGTPNSTYVAATQRPITQDTHGVLCDQTSSGTPPGGSSGDIQLNDGAGGFGAAHITDNGSKVTVAEPFYITSMTTAASCAAAGASGGQLIATTATGVVLYCP